MTDHSAKHLIIFTAPQDLPFCGGETVFLDGKVVPLVTSAAYNRNVGKYIMFGYLPVKMAQTSKFELEVFGERHAITCTHAPHYDPKNIHLKA